MADLAKPDHLLRKRVVLASRVELTHGSSRMDESQFNREQIPALYKKKFLFSGHWGLIHLVKELGKLVGEVLFVFFVGLEQSDWTSQKIEDFIGYEWDVLSIEL